MRGWLSAIQSQRDVQRQVNYYERLVGLLRFFAAWRILPFDEPAAVRAAGMEYVLLPIVHGAVTLDTMKRMHDAVRGLGKRKAFLHCSSGNRTAAALIPYFMIDKAMPEEQAVETAMGMGLRSAELMELALDYVRQGQAKTRRTDAPR